MKTFLLFIINVIVADSSKVHGDWRWGINNYNQIQLVSLFFYERDVTSRTDNFHLPSQSSWITPKMSVKVNDKSSASFVGGINNKAIMPTNGNLSRMKRKRKNPNKKRA